MIKNTKLKKRHSDIINRFKGNPVITFDDLSFYASDIRNAGAVKIGNTYLLLVTIKNLMDYKNLYIARSTNGFDFEVDDTPFLTRSKQEGFRRYEEISIMDGRITPFEDTYYVTYIAESRHGHRIGLAKTDDFKSITRIGLISPVDNKGGTLFPEKINGKYARLERPESGGRIWISYSEDLIYWGCSEIVLSPRPNFWDAHRIGDAVPPMRIKDGRWLLIYYGIKETSTGPLFRIGAAFLDADNPSKIVARTNIPILSPRENYERIGDITNLIFSCGAIMEENKLMLYYGGSDSCICLGYTTIDEIIEECVKSEGVF